MPQYATFMSESVFRCGVRILRSFALAKKWLPFQAALYIRTQARRIVPVSEGVQISFFALRRFVLQLVSR